VVELVEWVVVELVEWVMGVDGSPTEPFSTGMLMCFFCYGPYTIFSISFPVRVSPGDSVFHIC